jgi:hypothetical protein
MQGGGMGGTMPCPCTRPFLDATPAPGPCPSASSTLCCKVLSSRRTHINMYTPTHSHSHSCSRSCLRCHNPNGQTPPPPLPLQVACDRLLSMRVEAKLSGRRAPDVAGRLHVAVPKQRDGMARPPVIPAGVAGGLGGVGVRVWRVSGWVDVCVCACVCWGDRCGKRHVPLWGLWG